MKTNKRKKKPIHHRVLGKIKVEHIGRVESLPVVKALAMEKIAAMNDADYAALTEPEHVLVAVPKSAWKRVCDWLEGRW
jgi:hypothetical protein